MIGNILAASLTGGLDAVYGTGKVLPPGTKLEFTADKGKKQKTTSDIEKDIDMLTVAFFLTQEECNELLIDLLNLKSLQE